MEKNFMHQLEILLGHRFDAMNEIRFEDGRVRKNGGHDASLSHKYGAASRR
jgi:hypothetical protein